MEVKNKMAMVTRMRNIKMEKSAKIEERMKMKVKMVKLNKKKQEVIHTIVMTIENRRK